MDVQLKRGMLDAFVLKLLTRGDSYGYQLSQDAAQTVSLSESALYPVLKRLETGGGVESYTQEYGGRLRRYYRITEAGYRQIDAFLQEWEEIRKIYDFIREEQP